MRIGVEFKSAMSNFDTFVELNLSPSVQGGNGHGVLRRWDVVSGLGRIRGELDEDELNRERQKSVVALSAEQAAALVDAVRKVRVLGVSTAEHLAGFTDGWSTTLTIAHTYRSLVFRWSLDDFPSDWQGVDVVMETIDRIARELPESR